MNLATLARPGSMISRAFCSNIASAGSFGCWTWPDRWLLHGDLHHENILWDDALGWLAIDPKGVIGPKPMECGRFLHNFVEDEVPGINHLRDAPMDDVCEIMEMRIRTFAAALGLPRADLLRASFVDSVLSFCWTSNSDLPFADELIRVEAGARLLRH